MSFIHTNNIPNTDAKRSSLTVRVSLVLVGLGLAAAFAGGATLWSVSAQKADGLIINLAGRQRILTQKFTKETHAYLNVGQTNDGGEGKEFARKLITTRDKTRAYRY